MFSSFWKMIAKLTGVIITLLALFGIIELVRMFSFLHRISPILAATCFAVIAVLLIMLVIRWLAIPRALTPPSPIRYEDASISELRKHARYLSRYAYRLSENPNLSNEDQDVAWGISIDLKKSSRMKNPDRLAEQLFSAEEEGIVPLLKKLNSLASRTVRNSVRDVMLGVSLSPYHSVDLLIVLYRNLSMAHNIARIFHSRPTPREELLILRDTFRVVAAVNVMNLGRTLIENLFSNLPFIGRALDDIGQGLGAGVLTSATGHAAIDRCAAFRGWRKEEAMNSLLSHATDFCKDVRDIFTKDILPHLKPRIRLNASKETLEQPNFWERVTGGINSSLETAVSTLDSFIVQPTISGTRQVARAGAGLFVSSTSPSPEELPPEEIPPVEHHSDAHHRHSSKQRKHRTKSSQPKGIFRTFRTFKQRIQYTYRGDH